MAVSFCIFSLSSLRATALAAVFVTAAYTSSAQMQSINGSLRGTISDPSGAPLPNVSVTVKNLDTGFTRTVTTGDDGGYVSPNLPIGTYAVTATASGFAPLTQSGIHLSAGVDATVDETLKVGDVATEIQVTSDAPIIESARFDLGRTITAEETANLPLTSRNPYNFILFQPGVSGHPNTENGIPNTLNTNGLIDRVNYQLDGEVDTETDRYGLRLFAISNSYVQEVQTISNSFPPEFGNTAGIIYNVITGSGTNKIHGEANYIWRPKAASACPGLSNCDPTAANGIVKPSIHVDDAFGHLGAPIIKNRLFAYAAYEHLKRSTPAPINPGTQTTLRAAGVPESDIQTAPQVQRAQWFDGRIDWTINSKNQAFVRYNYFRNNFPFNTAAGGTNALSAAADFQDRAHDIGAQLLTTFSPRLLNEFRASWPYRNEQHFADPLTGAGPAISISASGSQQAANFGGSTGVGDKYQEKIPSFNDNVTYILGPHTFKFGAGFQKNNDDQLADVYTQFVFPSLAQYLAVKNGTAAANAYSRVVASIGHPGAAYHSVFFDFFAQDAWQVRKNLLFSYGLRYDQYRAPTPPAGEPLSYTQSFNTPKANFAPRIGIAYTPREGTVVRLNGGIFYEATPTNTWYNPLYNNAAVNGSFNASVTGNTSCAPAFPNSPENVPVTCLPQQSPYALTPKFKNEYTWNFNLQIAQELSRNDSLTLSYVMTNGRNMQFIRNINLVNPTGALADGRPIFSPTASASTRLIYQLPNGIALNNINFIDVGSNSSYNGLSATWTHRLSAGLTMSASYTWSHSISNTPEGNTYQFSASVSDPTNPFYDRGKSNINRPDAFNFSTVYSPKLHLGNRFANGFANGNDIAVLGEFLSGDPQNETTSTVLNGDSTATSRPLFVGRNTLVTPVVAQLDARFTRVVYSYHERINARLLVEGTNILNHTNIIGINTTAGTNAAGVITSQPSKAPTSTLDARILQFGMKIDF